MKAASSVLFLFLGMGVAGPTSAMTQADLASDSAMVPGTVFRDCPSSPEMVVVPAGTLNLSIFARRTAQRDRGCTP